MKFEVQYDSSSDIATVTVHGDCDLAGLREIAEALRTDARMGLNTAFLWDTGDAVIELTHNDLEHLIATSVSYAQRRGVHRTAIVTNTALTYGFARMAQAFAALWASPTDIQIFSTVEAATAWLQDPPAT